MAEFLCLHYRSERGEELAVNTDHVISMEPLSNGGSHVCVRGIFEDGVAVRESLSDILQGKFTLNIASAEGRQA